MSSTFKKISTTLVLLLLLSILHPLFSQGNNIGIPSIKNFPKEIYHGGIQTWGICQNQKGMLYFANNDGLMEFNGNSWQTYPIANRTICRSVAIDDKGDIYVGAQGEFGYFKPDSSGTLQYNSLNHLIPVEHRHFEDIWDILPTTHGLFFRSSQKIFLLKDEVVKVFSFKEDIFYLGFVNEHIIAQQTDDRILQFQNDRFIPMSGSEALVGLITDILPISKDSLIITTLKNSLYLHHNDQIKPWKTAADPFLVKNKIHCATLLPNGNIVLGTFSDGLVILSKEGKPLRHLNKEKGLQNNNIYSLYVDHLSNLWLGLDNGISYVEISSPFTKVYPDRNLEGSVYAAQIYQNHLYLGTSNGLFRIPWQSYYDPFKQHEFELVKNTTGQIWGLNVIDNQLLIGHHDGAYILKENEAKQISTIQGYWTFIELKNGFMIGGSYTGLNLFKKKENGWQFLRSLKGLEESSRIMATDKAGNIWVAHPYRGIFRCRLNPDLKTMTVQHYNAKDGLASDLFNHVFEVNNQVVFASENGVFLYNQASDQFEPYSAFNDVIGNDVQVKRLREGPNGNIWFAADENVGLLDVIDVGLSKKIEKRFLPNISGKLLGGFEHIYPIDGYNVFFGADKGAFHFDSSLDYIPDSSFQVFINQVYNQDSLVFGGNFSKNGKIIFKQSENKIPEFGHQHNAFRFIFSNNFYQDIEQVQYRYFLEGLNEEWSPLTKKTEKEYTNLSPGSYTFHLKAINNYDQESQKISYSFQIKAPWYANTIAYLFYFFLLLGITGALLLYQKNTYNKEKKELQVQQEVLAQQHKEKVAQSEKEIIQLRHDQLETKINFKNKELASTTMHLLQKGEMLSQIQSDLKKVIAGDQDIDSIKKEVNRLIRILNADEQLDNEWEQFAHHFDQVHRNFLKRISEQYPQLRPNDHRLCAYLRMNLSTKEIAHLLNLSVRGVEASRYRLRKKINLPGNVNLTEFMMQF